MITRHQKCEGTKTHQACELSEIHIKKVGRMMSILFFTKTRTGKKKLPHLLPISMICARAVLPKGFPSGQNRTVESSSRWRFKTPHPWKGNTRAHRHCGQPKKDKDDNKTSFTGSLLTFCVSGLNTQVWVTLLDYSLDYEYEDLFFMPAHFGTILISISAFAVQFKFLRN